MEKLRAIWHDVVDSLWFLPGLLTLAGGALAILLVGYNDDILHDIDAGDVWWLFGGSAEGAKSVLESISGSIITVTGVVFSVTIIALQLASSQFTPRVLRQFMADRANQSVLGVFIGTFTYTLLVQRTVRSGDAGAEFVPAIAVTGAVLLALISIGFFIFFINHLARSIQAAVIIDSVATSAMSVLDSIFPDLVENGTDAHPPYADELIEDLGEGTVIPAPEAGYLQAVDREGLSRIAGEHDLLICMEVEIGTYVLPGLTVMRAWPSRRVTKDLAADMCSRLILGLERTPRQDLKHGIIEMMDIAVKGMSPSINDPTTAINAVQRMGQVLLDMAWRTGGDSVSLDDDGNIRLIVRRPRLDQTTAAAFDQIRHYAADNPTVAIAMIDTLGQLSALSPIASRPAFTSQLQAVIRTANERITDPGDIERLQSAAGAALAMADQPPPERRPHV
ncbi:hypothetical protein BH23GEM9_BH23GEM9_16580 [soil metagenome]